MNLADFTNLNYPSMSKDGKLTAAELERIRRENDAADLAKRISAQFPGGPRSEAAKSAIAAASQALAMRRDEAPAPAEACSEIGADNERFERKCRRITWSVAAVIVCLVGLIAVGVWTWWGWL